MHPSPRLARELNTIEAMVKIYCNDHHHSVPETACASCKNLLKYAQKRLNCCPFQDNKPTCGNCTIHCYKKDMQAKVKKIMRYSGPRMIWHHPVMAIRHLIDSRKKAPEYQTPHQSGKKQES